MRQNKLSWFGHVMRRVSVRFIMEINAESKSEEEEEEEIIVFYYIIYIYYYY